MSIDISLIIGIVATLIAVISAIVSVYYNHKSQKTAGTSLNIAKFNSKESHRAQLMRWAESGMDSLSELYVIFEFDLENTKFIETKKRLLIELTSSIDKGRWLLPNNEHENFGNNKESAYTGFRQGALDDLVDAYDILVKANSGEVNPNISGEILKIKRRFTSAIQQLLEPRIVEEELSKIIGGN